MRIKVAWLVVVVALFGVGRDAQASSPCGIYARLDKVSVGPDENRPTWVLLEGDFLLVKTNRRQVGPARGFMCFSLEKAELDDNGFVESRAPLSGRQADLCRIEWEDLKGLVKTKGKGKAFVAFGSAFSEPFIGFEGARGPNVRETAEEAQQNPIPYPLHHGLTVLRSRRLQESDTSGRGAHDRNPVLVLQEYAIEQDGPPQ